MGSGKVNDLLVQSNADISVDGKYRYRLERRWSDVPSLPFVMLNPSTADAEVDDPTIRRCVGFARREGAGGIIVVNLFGLRATDPNELSFADDPFGPQNEAAIRRVAQETAHTSMPIICAWGAHVSRCADTLALRDLRAWGTLKCLGKTKYGYPRHPLDVKGDQPLETFP
jgi:hypothetical protein